MIDDEEKDFDQANDLVKSRQRYFRRPKRSAELLSKLMARKGYAQTESVNEIESTWYDVVGSKWKSKTKPGVIRNGVLEVLVISSPVNQQIGFQKKKILTQLQARLPNIQLKDLRFRIGDF